MSKIKTEKLPLQILLDAKMKKEFLTICKVKDRSAAQVLREYIRTYIAENQQLVMFDTK